MDNKLLELGFERYRAFPEPQRLELHPVTIIFGHNSAGKSAALRTLPILARSAAPLRSHPRVPTVLDYQSAALRDATFAEVVSHQRPGSGLRFWLRWEHALLDVEIRDLGRTDGERVTELMYEQAGSHLEARLSGSEGEAIYDLYLDGTLTPQAWELVRLRPRLKGESPDELRRYVENINACWDALSQAVHWVGAVRTPVPRYFELKPGTEPRIGSNGAGVAEVLRTSYLVSDGVAEAVSAWLKKACACELSFAETDAQVVFGRELYPFNVRPLAGGEAAVAVRDVGEGISQALPVVTLCHQARSGSLGDYPLLVFEQPELHLHPRATVSLADEIVNCALANRKTSHIIETHSESFLLAVQIALAEKRLRPEDVVVYWVEHEDGASSLRPIRFDPEGFPQGGWPEGVFRETVMQAQKLATLRLT